MRAPAEVSPRKAGTILQNVVRGFVQSLWKQEVAWSTSWKLAVMVARRARRPSYAIGLSEFQAGRTYVAVLVCAELGNLRAASQSWLISALLVDFHRARRGDSPDLGSECNAVRATLVTMPPGQRRKSPGQKHNTRLLIILKFYLGILICGIYLEIWVTWSDKQPGISRRWL